MTHGRLIALVAIMLGSSVAADWPMFRGNPQQTGVGSELPAKLDLLWKFNAKDAFEATAAIVGDTVYVGCYDGNFYAVSLKDGTEKWRYKAGPVKSSALVKDGLVYFGDLDGTFHCIDAAKGTKKWTFPTDGEIHSSPNHADGKIVFGASDSTLYCLEAATGKQVWKFKTDGAIECSPALVEGRTFVTGCDPTVHVVGLSNGKELAGFDLGIQGAASAAVDGDFLYVGNANKNSVIAVDWKKGEAIWEYLPERPFPFHSSAAVAGDLVLIGGRDKQLHAIDRKKGTARWTFPTRGKVDSSPVVVGDGVFVGSTDGNLYSVDLKTGAKLWQQELGSPIQSSPAVGQNRLVIGTTDGVLYCFGAK